MNKKEDKKVKELINEFKKTDGFTFVETVVVLSIVAVLAAGTTVSASKLISKAKKVSAQNQIEQLQSGLQAYFLDCGRFPTTEQGLGALWQKPLLYPVPENWKGPYIQKEPSKDPWGSDYQYCSAESTPLPGTVPEGLPYVLYSLGADCEEGGDGEAEDVCSWK